MGRPGGCEVAPLNGSSLCRGGFKNLSPKKSFFNYYCVLSSLPCLLPETGVRHITMWASGYPCWLEAFSFNKLEK